MDELARIEDQLCRAMDGEAWHGPAVIEVLEGVTPEQAIARPISGVRSIWQLVLHLGGAYRLVLRRLGGDARQLSPDEDWPLPPAPTSENWLAAVEELRSLNDLVRREVQRFAPERLNQPLIADPPYTAYTQFIGLTQHNLYHAGQIAILKRTMQQTDGK
jgi:hypothetical protein